MFKKNYRSRNIRGKLRVCRYLTANRSLTKNIPPTKAFTFSNMKKMAAAHSSLYIKPDVGSLGIGIFKMKRLRDGYELLSSKRGQRSKQFRTLKSAYRHIDAKRTGRMIIQKGIRLDRVEGNPYDIRVMVQRKPRSKWTCTGMLARVGSPNRIVTNHFMGGEAIAIASLHKRQGLTTQQGEARIRQMTGKALKIARTLSAKRSGMHELGIDYAYDGKGRLWVLEVNSNHPQFHPMKKFDREAYDRMLRYARSYGRKTGK